MELRVSGLSHRYGSTIALHRVSFTTRPGMTLLLGPNGAGKSTLLRLLATVERADIGLIALGGHTLHGDLRRIRRQIGYLPQRLDLAAELTPRRLLRYVAALKHQANRDVEESLLTELRLGALANRRIGTLSVGQVRRVGIALALIGAPRLLLLDEPLSGLDAEERAVVSAALRKRAAAATVVLSAHTPGEVAGLAQQVVVLQGGRIIAQGTTAELCALAGPVHELELPVGQGEGLSEQLPVSRLTRSGEGIRVRIVGPLPPGLTGAMVTPTLEDAYFWLIRRGSRRQPNRE